MTKPRLFKREYIDPVTKENYFNITLVHCELFDGKWPGKDDEFELVEKFEIDKDYFYNKKIFNGGSIDG